MTTPISDSAPESGAGVQTTDKSPRSFTDPLREIGAFALLGAVAVMTFFAFVDLLISSAGLPLDFSARSAYQFGNFVGISTIGFPLVAVLLATHVAPMAKRAKLVTLVALIEYAVCAGFGVITLLGALARIASDGPGTTFRWVFQDAVRHIVWLALLAVAGFAVMRVWQGCFSTPKPTAAAPGHPGYPGGYPGYPGGYPQPGYQGQPQPGYQPGYQGQPQSGYQPGASPAQFQPPASASTQFQAPAPAQFQPPAPTPPTTYAPGQATPSTYAPGQSMPTYPSQQAQPGIASPGFQIPGPRAGWPSVPPPPMPNPPASTPPTSTPPTSIQPVLSQSVPTPPVPIPTESIPTVSTPSVSPQSGSIPSGSPRTESIPTEANSPVEPGDATRPIRPGEDPTRPVGGV